MENVELVTKQDILGKEFTMYGTVEEPLFLAKDVANWIEHRNLTVMVNSVDDDEKIVLRTKDSLGRENSATFLTEEGFYEVLMLSRKPVAKAFKKAVKDLLKGLRKGDLQIIPKVSKEELDLMTEQNKVAKANIFIELSKKHNDNATYSQILDAYATKALEGKFILPLPKLEETNYSATEVGEMLGVSGNKIGSIAKRLGLKIDGEYGKWYVDKARNSAKEVNTFRYTQKAIDLIKSEIINAV